MDRDLRLKYSGAKAISNAIYILELFCFAILFTKFPFDLCLVCLPLAFCSL